MNIIKLNKGQSLLEILIAVGMLGFFIGGAVLSAQLALRISAQNKNLQTAALLAQELLDNFTVVAERDWHRVDAYGGDALSVAPAEYFIDTTVSPFSISSGKEVIIVDGVTYDHYFMVEKISRDGSEAIEPIFFAANEDPGTLKIVANVAWGDGAKVDLTKIVTRYKNNKMIQTDWSGGGGQGGVVGDFGRYDSADAGIDVSSKKGAIRLNGIAY